LNVDTKHRKWVLIAIILISVLSISALHYATPKTLYMWHAIFQHLYILPIIFAAFHFGWRGGLGTAAFAGMSYIPRLFVVFDTQPFQGYAVSRIVELSGFALAALVIGLLTAQERKQKHRLQQTTERLSVLYRELQDNFERMKQSERLSSIGMLSAGLAHELRNPLASIEGATAIVGGKTCTEEQRREFLEIIQKECRRLNSLLTHFLEFARPRTPQYQTVDLDQLLESTIGMAAHAIRARAIKIRKDLLSDMPALECDPEQLKQVILNLMINAIQAMPNGGEIVVAVRPQHRQILIEVRDQGCGIRPEHLKLIFDPFFTTKENGTGLGLSVAYQIVVQHGGVLTAENNKTKGATFSLLLPLKHGSVL
jgi:two-component system, NtrC family, sensor histidine kinase HydH